MTSLLNNNQIFQRIFILILTYLTTAHIAFTQKKIVVDELLDGTFREQRIDGFNWMNNGQYYTALENNKIVKYSTETGEAIETIVDGGQLGLDIEGYSFNSSEKKVLIKTNLQRKYRRSYTADYYIFTIGSKQAAPVNKRQSQSYATFSPDGEKVAYVYGNNLYYLRLDNMTEYPITNDGTENKIINGSTDWVYEEEFQLTKAFFWSDDSEKIAFYKFDESEVKEYTMQIWGYKETYPINSVFKYPKAGEDNSKIDILIYNLSTHILKEVDLGKEEDIYIPSISWTRDNNVLAVQRMNRLQNTLEILHVSAKTGYTEQILSEKVKTYIDFNYCNDLTYLRGGAYFLYSSEREGYKHFYLHRFSDGQLIAKTTSGAWEATRLVGLDQSLKTPVVYYISTEAGALERQLYSVDIFGKKKTRLTTRSGVHAIDMSNDCKYYVDDFSNRTTPSTVSLFSTKGNKLVKELKENSQLTELHTQYGIAEKELFSFKTKDLTELYGYLIKPTDFDSSKVYPLLIHQYSGPGSQIVMNNWGGGFFYWHQMLAQEGIIVAVIDTRGTNGRGEKFKKATYKQLGKLETEDHAAAATFLGGLSFVDNRRIGIWGWSYGGYASSLSMMLNPKLFKMGMAIAPVTNWRFYDTIYTERFLQRPIDNGKGYDDFSPVTHAGKLEGAFLLVHGTGDDNVHVQNSFALQEALVANRKQFDSFYYVDKAHGIGGIAARAHLFEMLKVFVLENL